MQTTKTHATDMQETGPGVAPDRTTRLPSKVIRPAATADIPVILHLIHGLAEYERAPQEVTITEAELLRDGFGDRPLYECLIAELDGEPVGLALFFPIYSTWKGASIHLEDLFVLPSARGQGLGKALLTRIGAIASERSCARLQWDVLDWNQPAIDFYQSLGAVFMTEWRIMRVTGDALQALATR